MKWTGGNFHYEESCEYFILLKPTGWCAYFDGDLPVSLARRVSYEKAKAACEEHANIQRTTISLRPSAPAGD